MDRKKVILGEIIQIQEDKYDMYLLICGICCQFNSNQVTYLSKYRGQVIGQGAGKKETQELPWKGNKDSYRWMVGNQIGREDEEEMRQ